MQIFSGHHTTAEKIKALHKYWEDAEYSFDLNIPNGSEPVIYLVKNKPPAHCELYASAACMLLRLANVPVRYATGFAVSDQQDGYWAVQNKDAHAWAQVWDAENRKWIDFDIAANSTGQPEISYSQSKSLPISQRFKASWLNSGIKGVAMLSAKIIAEFCGEMAKNTVFVSSLIFIVIILTAILAYKAYCHKKFSVNDSEIERLQKKLRKMDTLLQKRGLKRKLSETPIQFAQRLAQQGPCYNDRNEHIRWYKRYSQIRYSEKTQTMSSSLTDN